LNDTGYTGYGNNAMQQFPQGTPVYDINGDKVGTVAEADPQNNGLIIQKGLFFPKDIPVPMSAITRSDPDGIYLNVSKDDVSNGNWGATGYDNVDTQTPYRANAAQSVGDTAYDATQTARQTADFDRNRATTADTRDYQGDQMTQDGDIAVPVREEELVAGKQQGEIGRVRIHKNVVEEQQNITVPVRHEEVTIERVPVQGQASTDLGPDAFSDKDVEVPLMGEQAVVGKQARVSEEVRLHKQTATDQQQVSGTVRKEQVRVDGADTDTGDGFTTDRDGFTTDRDNLASSDDAPRMNR
jgi:uncharacterized protein (TIGR02271 family)